MISENSNAQEKLHKYFKYFNKNKTPFPDRRECFYCLYFLIIPLPVAGHQAGLSVELHLPEFGFRKFVT